MYNYVHVCWVCAYMWAMHARRLTVDLANTVRTLLSTSAALNLPASSVTGAAAVVGGTDVVGTVDPIVGLVWGAVVEGD